MEKFVPEGVNLPNVMTPGAWIVVGVIVGLIVAGFAWIILKFIENSFPPWKLLPVKGMTAYYYGKDNAPNEVLLCAALFTSQALLIKYTTWHADDIVNALRGIRIYVEPTPDWVDEHGQKVAGLDASGPNVVIGSDFAALLHECAHQCEEFIDHTVEYDHANWGAKGISAADIAYGVWLMEAKKPF